MSINKKQKTDSKEQVNHPSHYNTGKIEVIDYLEDLGYGEAFTKGNAIKYISRAGKKDATKEVEDLEKAVWYINRRIKQIKDARIKSLADAALLAASKFTDKQLLNRTVKKKTKNIRNKLNIRVKGPL